MNRALRTTGPLTYRLLAVQDSEGLSFGRMAAGRSLREDVAALRFAGMTPRYAVFIRPRGAQAAETALAAARRSPVTGDAA